MEEGIGVTKDDDKGNTGGEDEEWKVVDGGKEDEEDGKESLE